MPIAHAHEILGLHPDSGQHKPARELSSTQVNLQEPLAGHVRAFGAMIPQHKLAEDGREEEPHITLKYGLHDDTHHGAAAAIKGEPPITAQLGTMSLFKGPDAHVLKVDVHSPDLHRLNGKIKKAVKTTDTHPKYTPHVTIAYLRPGMGKKYEGRPIPNVTGKTVTFDHVIFSGKDKQRHNIPLTKPS
jgi:2'-5' RNA ligase